MKPFDLQKAIAGDAVILMQQRNNEPLPVRYLAEMSDKRIVVEWQDCYEAWHLLPCWATELRMAPRKRLVYVTLYKSGCADWVVWDSKVTRMGESIIAGPIAVEIED